MATNIKLNGPLLQKEQQLQQIIIEYEACRKTAAQLHDLNTHLLEERDSAQKQLLTLQASLKLKQFEYDRLSLDFDKLTERHNQIEQELEKSVKRQQETDNDFHVLQQQFDQTTHENSEMKARIINMERSLALNDKSYTKKIQESVQMQSEISSLQEHIKQLTKRSTEKDRYIQLLIKERDNLNINSMQNVAALPDKNRLKMIDSNRTTQNSSLTVGSIETSDHETKKLRIEIDKQRQEIFQRDQTIEKLQAKHKDLLTRIRNSNLH